MIVRATTTPRPKAPDLLADNIPSELRECAQWVCWRFEKRDDKWTKVPYCAKNTKRRASSTDRDTWATFDEAIAAHSRGGVDGIGFTFTDDDNFIGIDLDKCIDAEGRIDAEAERIVGRMASYTEVTPSGTGLHIIARGTLPPKGRRKGNVEMYCEGRFFTMTGHAVPDTPEHVEERTAELADLHREIFSEPTPERKPVSGGGFDGDDHDLIERAKRSDNGAKFTRVWNGDASDYGDDHSRADMALCTMLAFWTGRDAARMDRLFRRSGLMRGKWDSRRGQETYGQRTLREAVSKCRDVYTPGMSDKDVDDYLAQFKQPTPASDATPTEQDESPEGRGVEACWRLCTDMGNGMRFLRRNRGRVRYCYGPERWLIWDGKRWAFDDGGRVVKLAQRTVLGIMDEVKEAAEAGKREQSDKLLQHFFASQRRERINAMLDQAKPHLAIRADELDRDPWLFNCESGTVDLRTGEQSNHNPRNYITKIAPVRYDPDAKSPLFERFIHRSLASDPSMIAFVQRWLGLSLSGDIREQKLPIFWGEGNNGKSVLLDTITAIMGDYAGQAAPELLTASKHERHPTELADLMGKRLVVASETEDTATLRLQLVKRLTGDDRIKARRMRTDFFEFTRTHKLILVTNNKPRIREHTEAVWRRVRLVPFTVVIPPDERDPSLSLKLRGEWPGILAWLVQGCRDWLREGLMEPDAVRNATAEYRTDQDPLGRFIEEVCEVRPGGDYFSSDYFTREELYAAYEAWCEGEGYQYRVPKKTLYEAVRKLDGVTDTQRKIEGRTTRIFEGIRHRGNSAPATAQASVNTGGYEDRSHLVASDSVSPPYFPANGDLYGNTCDHLRPPATECDFDPADSEEV